MSVSLTKDFFLIEFVHPKFIKIHGERRCIDFLHAKLARTAQQLRNKFGKAVINGIFKGVKFVNSGLRLPFSRTGAKNSRHKQGVCFDIKFYGATAIEVQKYILAHPDEFPWIVAMEDARITKHWLHVEVGKRIGPIYIFKP